jgi:hypothetical protein
MVQIKLQFCYNVVATWWELESTFVLHYDVKDRGTLWGLLCNVHRAKSMVASQWLEASSQFGAMLMPLLNGMHYGWFQARVIFYGSTFKLHQCFFSWINHDYKSNVIVNGIGMCQLCQSYFLQLFWRVFLDLSFNVFFATAYFMKQQLLSLDSFNSSNKDEDIVMSLKKSSSPLKKVCLLPNLS